MKDFDEKDILVKPKRAHNQVREEIHTLSKTYSPFVTKSLQLCGLNNNLKVLQNIEDRYKNRRQIVKIQGLQAVLQELLYSSKTSEFSPAGYIDFEDAFEVFMCCQSVNYTNLESKKLMKQNFQDAVLNQKFGLCCIIATIPECGNVIVLQPENMDLTCLMDHIACSNKTSNSSGTIDKITFDIVFKYSIIQITYPVIT